MSFNSPEDPKSAAQLAEAMSTFTGLTWAGSSLDRDVLKPGGETVELLCSELPKVRIVRSFSAGPQALGEPGCSHWDVYFVGRCVATYGELRHVLADEHLFHALSAQVDSYPPVATIKHWSFRLFGYSFEVFRRTYERSAWVDESLVSPLGD